MSITCRSRNEIERERERGSLTTIDYVIVAARRKTSVYVTSALHFHMSRDNNRTHMYARFPLATRRACQRRLLDDEARRLRNMRALISRHQGTCCSRDLERMSQVVKPAVTEKFVVVTTEGNPARLEIRLCSDPKPHLVAWEWGSIRLHAG